MTQQTIEMLEKPRVAVDVDALGFLRTFSRKANGQPFSAEQVTGAAALKGIEFQDRRAWGAVFIQAAREGYIRRSTELFSRTTSNGSVRPGWVGL